MPQTAVFDVEDTIDIVPTFLPMAQFRSIFAASFIPTFMVFGLLCRRFALKTLLFWGTVIAVPQMVPLLFIHQGSKF